ncbi:MAG: phosphatase PAP2 family protein, partial [Candidatus Eisenbacteria bacterium]|nr:phosphatase PAP2 family protein [Candidatus Eisenbacteria bacterium]
MEALVRLDGEIIVWVQSALRGPWLDAFFTTLTNGRLFVGPLLALALLILWRGGAAGRWWVLAMAVAILLTDQLSSAVVKPLVGRTRPCFAVAEVEALVRQARSASFPSSHAANSFGVATLLWLGFPRWRWAALALASLVSFSRIYVGVHYPSDVLAGAAL